ncbi:mannose-1-phosphate guanylyltransferase [Desulfoferrobacter suflitae]|uniref:mannose-1-phosphate guanylyltransferase n=1 Tax=Desulfoferrobacter suflitae TaxID=2865782 RepID=UPI0021643BD7|nr:sugar phosphate nucleotidyltransferase [Desulfoferrobacter suflitae]MCK8603064.1 sugar phosphate nucleotidyltransferase [Desulfoferrobacter suflitae]
MYIVIMAGGSGTRFWPASRESLPKQFLNIVGDRAMIVETYERIRPLAPDDHIILVIGQQHLAETERLFAGRAVRILAEPAGRNTAPCIGLAAKYVEHLGGKDPIVIVPADHYIARPEVFRSGLVQAAQAAARGAIVTLGIIPTRSETGYGYIERAAEPEENNLYRVRTFVEKPNPEMAADYLARGSYFWNAGIFVATPRTLLAEFTSYMPSFARGLEKLRAAFDTTEFPEALQALYGNTEAISFDYAIMEKTTQPVYVVPSECGWSDVGSWYSLYEVRKEHDRDDLGNIGEGDTLLLDSKDSFVVSRGKRFLAVLGLTNVLVVDTEDALLVADLNKSQEVKRIVERLKESASKDLL